MPDFLRKFPQGALILILLFSLIFENLTSTAFAKTQVFKTTYYNVTVDLLVDNLSHPWGVSFLPDGAVLITERSGILKLVSPTRGVQIVAGIPEVWAEGQGGLLDIALHPEFAKTKQIYLSYSEPSDDQERGGTALALGRLERSPMPKIRDLKVLFSQTEKTDSSRHFGSRIAISPANRLFLTIGDRGDKARAQDPFDHAGSIIRLNLDGTVPVDNPFISNGNGLPEIWSTGHRNPQGAIWNPSTESLWTVSHGARGGDEINHIKPARNYGWPVISYGTHYWGTQIGEGTHKDGMEQPVYYWDPSIAPSGFTYYQGEAFPDWRGQLFVGALKFETIVRLKVHNNKVLSEERLFKNKFGRIRDVRQGPEGYLYFLTDEDPGQLYRIRPF